MRNRGHAIEYWRHIGTRKAAKPPGPPILPNSSATILPTKICFPGVGYRLQTLIVVELF